MLASTHGLAILNTSFFFFNLLLAFNDVGICSEMSFNFFFKRKHKFFFYFLGNMLVNKLGSSMWLLT